MADLAKEVIRVNIEDEMRQSYLDYAMSVIVGRALPDARDGLKPVHRRVLFAMSELGTDYNKPYKKSARIVGDVIGKYHPHGDTAVYDSLVRMAQPFSLRYMLIDGQGNFGSVDGDSAAAMRYTEARMSKLAHMLLMDIDRETVDFGLNYDESEREPLVLPSRAPNLLINGSSGIAVGMATNIPPHNLTEVVNAVIALMDDPEITLEGLMQHLPGPDFPTAGIINGSAGIIEAYQTGRGRVLIRAKAEVEVDPSNGRESIIVHELPFQVNKARLIEKIAELVKEKKIEGISELRDESDKDGMRIYMEMKRGESGEVILNNLYKQTQMQVTFGINMVALIDGQPRLLTLRDALNAFIRHRREVVTRRTIFDLRKARNRAHILEGMTVALANIDEMIELIKTSASPAEARERMLNRRWDAGVVGALLAEAGTTSSRPEDLPAGVGMLEDGYQLSEVQAKEILDMRLNRLTGLEQEKLTDEYRQLLEAIRELIAILKNPDILLTVIREELAQLIVDFGDPRRTEIQINREDLLMEDLIPREELVVTLSHSGYVKAQPIATYRAQRRGGRGRSATSMKDEDFVDTLLIANSHDTILCFTSLGRVFWLRTFQFPQSSPQAKGRPIVNLLPAMEGDEKVNAMLPVKEFSEDEFVFFATRNGTVKKTALAEFSRPRASGIRAVELREGDRLIEVALTNGQCDVMLFASSGKCVRFSEAAVRKMGRTATGVRGIKLTGEAKLVSMIIPAEGDILTVTERGFGKRTALEEFPVKGRGTQGVIGIKTSKRNGALIGATQVTDEHEIMLISDFGTLVRTRASEVAQVGRNTQGVTLIRLAKDETLVGVDRVEALEDDEAINGEIDGELTEPESGNAAPDNSNQDDEDNSTTDPAAE